jgi:ABC-type bacteriocin/lantibiotic exporter with double-glycine peptidase domain
MHVAQDSPTQAWIDDWLAFLSDRLPLIFLVVVLFVGMVLVAKTKGGLGKVIAFGVGAALVFLLLTNVETISSFFGDELPIPQD